MSRNDVVKNAFACYTALVRLLAIFGLSVDSAQDARNGLVYPSPWNQKTIVYPVALVFTVLVVVIDNAVSYMLQVMKKNEHDLEQYSELGCAQSFQQKMSTINNSLERFLGYSWINLFFQFFYTFARQIAALNGIGPQPFIVFGGELSAREFNETYGNNEAGAFPKYRAQFPGSTAEKWESTSPHLIGVIGIFLYPAASKVLRRKEHDEIFKKAIFTSALFSTSVDFFSSLDIEIPDAITLPISLVLLLPHMLVHLIPQCRMHIFDMIPFDVDLIITVMFSAGTILMLPALLVGDGFEYQASNGYVVGIILYSLIFSAGESVSRCMPKCLECDQNPLLGDEPELELDSLVMVSESQSGSKRLDCGGVGTTAKALPWVELTVKPSGTMDKLCECHLKV